MTQGRIKGSLFRGGTSKGFFVQKSALPQVDSDLLDDIILETFGTPDPLQVDGIGGGVSSTSKLMIVSKSLDDAIDVEYTFAQPAITKPVVDWSGNCGNLTSAIGSFAILESLVEPNGSPAKLVLYNTNTDTIIQQTIPLSEGLPNPYGDYVIDGVPGAGSRIDSNFVDPAGGVLGKLAPTNSYESSISLNGQDIHYTLLDVTNPCIFVSADDLSLSGTELPGHINKNKALLEKLELIRGTVCQKLGLVDKPEDAVMKRPMVPFIAIVSPPQNYVTSTGDHVDSGDIDITARIITTQTPHHAYAVTGAMCLAAATQLNGTIPNKFVNGPLKEVRIGHPKGKINIGVDVNGDSVNSVTVSRTAREIMRGSAYYRYIDKIQE